MKTEFRLPELGENIPSGDIVKILVREGQMIEPGEAVFELETDKAVVEVPCPQGGRVERIHVAKGDTVEVGQVLITLAGADEAALEEEPAAETEVAAPARAAAGQAQRSAATAEAVVPPGQPGEDAWGPVRRDGLSQIRRTIAATMVRAAGTIPQATNFDDADVTELERLRKNLAAEYARDGIKLTALPFVMKAAARALRRHPTLNASLDEQNQQVVYKEYVNLGVAVDTPRGLVVPVMRNVDRLEIAQIAAMLRRLAEEARASRFSVEDLRGGTFTLSNLGAIGGTYSTPIINHPEVAILLLGRWRWMPVVREGEICKRLMMPLSLAYDHRLVDGAAAARFLNEVIDRLQSPDRLLRGA